MPNSNKKRTGMIKMGVKSGPENREISNQARKMLNQSREIPNQGRKMSNQTRKLLNQARKSLNQGRKLSNQGLGNPKWITGSSISLNWKEKGNCLNYN
jgi:hypothetical protein